MDKNDTSSTGNYLVPTSGQAIARRSDSLVVRGLRELDAAEQKSRCSQDVFQRLDKLYLSYGRGIGLDDGVGVCKADESSRVFLAIPARSATCLSFSCLGMTI